MNEEMIALTVPCVHWWVRTQSGASEDVNPMVVTIRGSVS